MRWDSKRRHLVDSGFISASPLGAVVTAFPKTFASDAVGNGLHWRADPGSLESTD